MKINKILLSHPYSGSLYAYFTEQMSRRSADSMLTHPYYRTLYGKNFKQHTDFALTLTLLYKNIIITGADNHRPKDDEYPELGLIIDRDNLNDFHLIVREQAEYDAQDKVIKKILSGMPEHARSQILRDTRTDMHLAEKHKCPIICSGGRREIIKRLVELDDIHKDPNLVPESSILMMDEYIDLTGLLFNPKDLDVLHALKADKDIRGYADGFVSIMHNFREKQNVRTQLLLLMQESMNKAIISNNTAGVFDVVSNVLGVLGIVVTNPAVSIADLALDGISRLTNSHTTKQEWFQFAPEVKKQLTQAKIDLAISKELNKSKEDHS